MFSIVYVLVKFELTLTTPKSVWSVAEGVASPSTIETEFPVRFISGAIPVPCTSKLYVPSSASVLVMFMVARCVPAETGA